MILIVFIWRLGQLIEQSLWRSYFSLSLLSLKGGLNYTELTFFENNIFVYSTLEAVIPAFFS